ncbi:MAG: DUF4430 domain-containing protein [Clostridia bacterium]|nr:DUF4430 domain-containing protein [Clostridia bacterium]
MKRKMISFVTLLVMVIFSAFCLVACGGGTAAAEVVETTDTLVVIRVEKTDEEATLFDVMEALQEDNALQFELSGTMLKSLNGTENASDFSSCWMLYTSDNAMGNSEWGTYDYNGTSCLSAILGGDALTVSAGAYYVWVYQTF